MFEKASRKKLRFGYSKGLISVEQLWDIPLKDLDELALSIKKRIDETSEGSFLEEKKIDPTQQLCLDICVHIIGTRVKEQKEAEARAEAIKERKRLLEIIGQKEDEELRDLSVKELKKKARALSKSIE